MSFVFLLCFLLVIGIIAFNFTIQTGQALETPSAPDAFAKVLDGSKQMTPEISKIWGMKAHRLTNKARAEKDLDWVEPYEWSDKLHMIAYTLNQDVVAGRINFGETNFLNLVTQARSSYLPDFEVVSMSEQISKIANIDPTRADEDFIGEWADNWTVDHVADVLNIFHVSATSVYFDAAAQEVLFTQLFAQLEEIFPYDE